MIQMQDIRQELIDRLEIDPSDDLDEVVPILRDELPEPIRAHLFTRMALTILRGSLPMLLLAAALHAQSFYGLGSQIEASNVPHPTGWAVIAIPANDQIWSFTEHDVQLVGRPLKVQTSTRTGIATPCKALGRVTVYCLGDSGVATAGGNISAAFAVGAIAAIPWKKWFILAGFRVLDTPSPVPGAKSTTRYAEIGFGRRFQ